MTYATLWRIRGEALIVTAVTDPVARAGLVAEFDARGLCNGRDYLLGG